MADADQIRFLLEEGALHWALLRHAVTNGEFRASDVLTVLNNEGITVGTSFSTVRDHAKRLADRGVLDRAPARKLTYVPSQDGRLIYQQLAPILDEDAPPPAPSTRMLALVARTPDDELVLATGPSEVEAELLTALWRNLTRI